MINIKSNNFLLILLGIDSAFILLSLINIFSNLSFSNYLVQLDGGFAEKFQYLKFIGISLMSFLLGIKKDLFNIYFLLSSLYIFIGMIQNNYMKELARNLPY